MSRIKSILKALYNIINEPSMVFLPGNLAFFIVLSIFPILSLTGMLASYFSLPIDNLVASLEGVLPNSLSSIFVPYILNNSFSSNIIISTIIAFFIASNGAHALILASNSLYEIQNSGYIKRRIKSLFLILLLILIFLFLLSFLTYGNQLFKIILETITYKPINNILYYIFAFIKWPIAMIIIFVIVKTIYVLAPDSKIYSSTTNKGAIFTTLGWTIATAIFSFYIANFSHYDVFYGNIANIIVLMVWIYILSFILVIGIAINVRTYNNKKYSINNKE